MLWHSSGTVEPVEERTSDVNFSMGVASRGRTKLRWQPFLKHFQLESNINCVPGFTEGMTASNSPSLVSFALRAKSCSMWAAFSIVNDAALLLYTNKSAVHLSVAGRERIERDRDQVGHFRAARVRRTKNKSSFVSLVDDRATWHIVCFSFLDLSFRGFSAFPTHTAAVTCRPRLGGD